MCVICGGLDTFSVFLELIHPEGEKVCTYLESSIIIAVKYVKIGIANQ